MTETIATDEFRPTDSAIEIINQAFRLIVDNWGVALRLAGAVSVVSVGAFLLLLHRIETYQITRDGVILGISAIVLLSSVGFVAVVIGWHRFVLLGERSGGVFPPFAGRRMARYFFVALLLNLVIIGLVAAIGAVVLLWLPKTLALLLILPLSPLSIYLSLRLGLALPATATDARFGLVDSWRATAPHRGMLFRLTLLLIGCSVAAQLAAALLAGAVGDIPPSVAVGALTALAMASIWSVLYGHIVEERPLP